MQPIEGEGGAWQARNPGQQWTTRFDGRGFLTTPQAAEWRWGLALASYGFGDHHTAAGGAPEVRTDGGRLTYRWDGRMEEWFVNDPRGLEHGFVLQERPAGAGDGQPLEVVLAVRGGLRAGLSADGQTVHFRDKAGAPVVNYGGLKVWDADGKVLPSSFAPGAGSTVVLRVEEAAARYPLTIDPIARQAYLKASNTERDDKFGISAAVSGDTVVVGAFEEDSSATGVNGNEADNSAAGAGAVYVFVRNGTGWTQQAYLKASNTGGGDFFGSSVAVSGDTVVVGAFREDSNATGINGSQTDNSFIDSGAAYVFVRVGTTWTQQAYLKASNTGTDDFFGYSMAISGDTVVIGSYREDSNATGINGNQADDSANDAGAAYVFARTGTTWTQQAYLKASDTTYAAVFGISAAVSGDTVVIGASVYGTIYVFARNGAAWTQQAYLKTSNGTSAGFGGSVAVSGDTAVVGAASDSSSARGVNCNSHPEDTASGSGAAYVFVRSGITWTQQAYLKAGDNDVLTDRFGSSVALSGDTVVVGAYASRFFNGTAYVFRRSGTAWSQHAQLHASSLAHSDKFGTSVAVSGDLVVVGAPGDFSNATGVNGNEADTSSGQSGAAYIFTGAGEVMPPAAEITVTCNGQPICDDDERVRAGNHTDFGSALARFGEVTRTFTIVNDGIGALNLTGTPRVMISGPNAAEFAVTLDPVTPVAANGGTTAFQVRFTPRAEGGGRSATLTIANDDIDENPFNFTVAGTGAPHPLTIERPAGNKLADETTTDFESVAAGASGTPQIFTIRNSGTVEMTGLTLSVDGGNAGDFAVSAPESTTVPAGGSATFTVTFTPGGQDARTCTLRYGVDAWPVRQVRLRGYGQTGAIINAAHQAYLKASNTEMNDSFGYSVAVSGDTVVVGAYSEDSAATGVNGDQSDNSVTDSGAVYVFVRSGTAWTQQAYLKASNTGAGDFFGYSVAVSGDTVVVGAYGEDSNATGVNGNEADESAEAAGAAYVFVRSGTTWTKHAYLKASNTGVGDYFGSSVAISGDTVVVGAFREDSNTTGINGNQADNSVTDSGAAYVFTRSGTTWMQHAYLKASNTGGGDYFAYSVAVSGDTVVVGAYREDSSATGVNGLQANNLARDSGAAYVFTRSGTTWTQQAYLKAGNTGEFDYFGTSVAVSGDTVVVGALGEDGSATGVNGAPQAGRVGDSGAAYVFVRIGTAWTQQAYLKASNTGREDYFGYAVAASGDTVVVGAYREDSPATGVNGNQADDGAKAGAAYIFTGVSPVLTLLEGWRQLHFGSPANSGDAADDFDSDGDGLVNLLEWAVGTYPRQPNLYQPELVRNGANLEFTYTRSLPAFNAWTGYAVEWSETLAAGSWQTTGVTQSVLSTAGDVQTVRATVPMDTGRRYLRLSVTAP